MNIIYYYQTFVGLEKLKGKEDVTNIFVSSIHFNNKNMYLNDNIITSGVFSKLWEETENLSENGVHMSLMIGGAGGAFKEFFSDYHHYYSVLVEFLTTKPWFQGINIDVEENVNLDQLKYFIKQLRNDFGETFLITMAPVASSMSTDNSGMGGFSYKELYQSESGEMIDYFLCQCYDSFSLETYKSIIDNGYPENKIVMGMLSGQFKDDSFKNHVHDVKSNYPMVCGFFDWEYLDAPPNKNDPSDWAKIIKEA